LLDAKPAIDLVCAAIQHIIKLCCAPSKLNEDDADWPKIITGQWIAICQKLDNKMSSNTSWGLYEHSASHSEILSVQYGKRDKPRGLQSRATKWRRHRYRQIASGCGFSREDSEPQILENSNRSKLSQAQPYHSTNRTCQLPPGTFSRSSG
jgi:hypothetical protein